MLGSGEKPRVDIRSEKRPHEEFVELCAVSTSGELSEEEQKRLQDHLATCAECRQALMEFESAAEIGVPLLHSKLSASASSESQISFDELIERTTPESLAQLDGTRSRLKPGDRRNGLFFAHRNGRGRAQVNWNYVWMSAAAALIVTGALSIYSFQLGKQKHQPVMRSTADAFDRRVEALEQQISDLGHDREVLRVQLVRRNRLIAAMRRQITEQLAALAEAKSSEASLGNALENNQVQKQQVIQERSDVLQKLDIAHASLQKTQAELDSLQQERSQDEARAGSLEAQIRDLHSQLRDREQQVGEQEQLLAHDRDIRELMGARELYIAEVYDVARDGQTQKPYGRVFYTKGKSLVFYAYDLDQERGLQRTTAFQAWGRRGGDRQQALNLGIFYEDNSAKRRWVLKFDNPKVLEEIDGVFVTVEPKGGSQMPSGKQLLFASLAVEPNHP
jgi:Putative zinc-finger